MPTKVAFSEFPAPELSGGGRTWENGKNSHREQELQEGKGGVGSLALPFPSHAADAVAAAAAAAGGEDGGGGGGGGGGA
jgi:hypothetical protein